MKEKNQSIVKQPLDFLANKMMSDMTRLEALFRAMTLVAQEHDEKFHVPGSPDLTSLIEIASQHFDNICDQAALLETRLQQMDTDNTQDSAKRGEAPQKTCSACRTEKSRPC